MLFSNVIARRYLATEMNQRLKPDSVRCRPDRPDNNVCEVKFPGDITMGVSLIKVPGYVIARQMYARAGARRRGFDYACTPDGNLKLVNRPDIVRIVLIDLAGYFKNNGALRGEFTSRLERKANNLEPAWLKQQLLRFSLEYRASEPTAEEKEGFSKLDFPIYLLGRQHGYDSVRELMEQHNIPRTIKCIGVDKPVDPYRLAEKCWKGDAERGCGIPSGEGFRKVGFIKTHTVSSDPIGRRDLAQAFLNVTAHEIGHMSNICFHDREGLMKYPVPLNMEIDFSLGDRGFILASLTRLKNMR